VGGLKEFIALLAAYNPSSSSPPPPSAPSTTSPFTNVEAYLICSPFSPLSIYGDSDK